MANDLTLADLNAAAGSAVFSVSGANITINAQLLLGEPTFSLSDEKVAELLTRVLSTAAKAQSEYNALPANIAKLDSYPTPISGIPFFEVATDQYFVTSTYSFSSRAPLNLAATTAVQV